MCFLHGLREGMSGISFRPGNFPFSGMHPVRQMYRSLSRKMLAFFGGKKEQSSLGVGISSSALIASPEPRSLLFTIIKNPFRLLGQAFAKIFPITTLLLQKHFVRGLAEQIRTDYTMFRKRQEQFYECAEENNGK